MTKLTKNQQGTIVTLFGLGTSIADLSTSYQVPLKKIEGIIRHALTMKGGDPDGQENAHASEERREEGLLVVDTMESDGDLTYHSPQP